MSKVVEIAVFRPLKQYFTYTIDEKTSSIQRGDFVEIPFGKQRLKGICIKAPYQQTVKPKYTLKSIFFLYPSEYRLPENILKLAEWMSNYYINALGEVLQCASSPAPLKKASSAEAPQTKKIAEGHTLTDIQKSTLEHIRETGCKKPILLHGITGSGKTEIYLQRIEDTLNEGKSCIYLVPEITLTRETLRKLTQRFENILVFHSAMTAKERRETWLASKQNLPFLIIGARSSLFTPVTNLGLIIVDEEHDSSFKQDSTPRYHGRDLALVRASFEKAQVILGSATPSLETFFNASSGKYQLIQMLKRISPHPLPTVHVVNIADEKQELKRESTIHFSRLLIQMTRKALMKKRQVVFLLNRRGFSTLAICPACNEKVECENCSVPLTYYKKKHTLLCHHCDFQISPPPSSFPRCQHPQMLFRGTGTEKIHEMLQQLFPDHEVIRVDGSNDSGKDIQTKVQNFMKGEGHIMLGTQIIAKGLDSPNIQLSAAINADLGLNMPDFRSAERDFQMLTQLAGRTGRGDIPGECVFQTMAPDHYAIRHSIQQNYNAFYLEESNYRKQMGYPPFKRLARYVFTAVNEQHLGETLKPLMKDLRIKARELQIQILGPSPAPIERIKNKYRWQILLKSSNVSYLTHFLNHSSSLFDKLKRVDTILDRDPQNMM